MKRTLPFKRSRLLLPVYVAAIFFCATKGFAGAAPRQIESDPIKCWWKTDRSAVQVGEQFVLALTCGVIDTHAVAVIPDLNQLDPGAMQLPPFEVLGGRRHQSIKAGTWQYFQYEYTLRLIEDNFFRLDVDIPPLRINYTVRMTEGAAAQQGREQSYILPALPVRINSLVPKNASGIRDASRETFGDIEARSLRARSELIAAGICFAFAVVLLGLAAARATEKFHARRPAVVRLLSRRAVARGCAKELGRLKSEVGRAGWTPELAARALTALRIAGAIALRQPVTQIVVTRDVARDGQLVLGNGVLPPKRVLVSASVTSHALTSLLAADDEKSLDTDTRAALEAVRDAMHAFSAACYGRDAQFDAAALDAALEQVVEVLQRKGRFKLRPVWSAGESKKTSTPIEDWVWSR